MINFVLLMIAWFGFLLFSIVGIPYSALYYIRRKEPISYSKRYAIGVDKMCNAAFGELLEAMFAKRRGVTYFGDSCTVSAAIGGLIAKNNINNFGIFVSGILSKLDGNSEHCLDSYRKEILNLEK